MKKGPYEGGYKTARVAGIRAIIWKNSRKIAAPQLQTQMGGDKNIAQVFDDFFWQSNNDLDEKPVMVSWPKEKFIALARLWLDDQNRIEAAVYSNRMLEIKYGYK